MKDKKDNYCHVEYPNHEKELPRLKRAIGQLNGIHKMIIEKRYCPEILQQLKAVRSAIKAIEINIFKTHLESCVIKSFVNDKEKFEKISEIKQLLDKF